MIASVMESHIAAAKGCSWEYREKTVQCLIRAQYGRGGPFIMETLLHYFTIENYLRRDSNTGLWLLLGNIVQIGMCN